MDRLETLSDIILIKDVKEIHNKLKERCRLDIHTEKKIEKICGRIAYPITIIVEMYYVDKVYRDTYYNYFSNKHFERERNCKRLSLFKGIVEKESVYTFYKTGLLQQMFIGTIVLKPFDSAKLGRTLLNPGKLNIEKAYIRTTRFDVVVLGINLYIEAFPFTEQDMETMTCSETTIWAILEYFGTRYSEYRTVLPGEITKSIDRISRQRVLPSTGIDYYTVSNTLKDFGFQPKIYALSSFQNKKINFKRIFHYYVESGIPIGVGINLLNFNTGHSIVCIGHADSDYAIEQNMLVKKGELYFINSCDFYQKYVIIDDNQIPYTIEAFNDFTIYTPAEANIFVVPLYKRIFLEADKVDIIMNNMLEGLSPIIVKILNGCHIENRQEKPLVTRLFLTSSRKFKMVRVSDSKVDQEVEFYANILYPKFLWIIEISTYGLYRKNQILGEIVLDATSVEADWRNYIISMRLCNYLGYRLPDEKFEHLIRRFNINNNKISHCYMMYLNNLK